MRTMMYHALLINDLSFTFLSLSLSHPKSIRSKFSSSRSVIIVITKSLPLFLIIIPFFASSFNYHQHQINNQITQMLSAAFLTRMMIIPHYHSDNENGTDTQHNYRPPPSRMISQNLESCQTKQCINYYHYLLINY